MIAAGKNPVDVKKEKLYQPEVIGLAVSVLTFAAALHIFTRRGGIWINNTFAAIKVSLLVVICILGLAHAGGRLQHGNFSEMIENSQQTMISVPSADINAAAHDNLTGPIFTAGSKFTKEANKVASVVGSFLMTLYSYAGFDQPFHVLTEVRRPRKVLPKYTLLAMLAVTVLYTLVNISYLCVVPKHIYLESGSNIDMATTFFQFLFSKSEPDANKTAQKASAGLIAISILGNILAITFTAARVKQSIAKEGILPYSLFFAAGSVTPWARLWRPKKRKDNIDFEDDDLERSPIAALGLHWATSIFLLIVTISLTPGDAYTFLISLYSYVNVSLFGFLVSGGMLYLRLDSYIRKDRGRKWMKKLNFRVWTDPAHVVIYFLAMGFFLLAALVPTTSSTAYPSYTVPVVGLTSLFAGVLWWLGLLSVEWRQRWKLVVHITPYVKKDEDGQFVRLAELIEHEKRYNEGEV